MFDLIIQQARICDGTGNPSFVGTLGVTDGRITYLGRDTGLVARPTMNADGLAEGYVADLVLFDPQTVAAKPPEYVRDFPRQGRRLISKAEGIVATFIAGTQVYAQGTHTEAFPGHVLRRHA
jgi:N-acyl-D-aspartate/D-glutamate deacylase